MRQLPQLRHAPVVLSAQTYWYLPAFARSTIVRGGEAGLALSSSVPPLLWSDSRSVKCHQRGGRDSDRYCRARRLVPRPYGLVLPLSVWRHGLLAHPGHPLLQWECQGLWLVRSYCQQWSRYLRGIWCWGFFPQRKIRGVFLTEARLLPP